MLTKNLEVYAVVIMERQQVGDRVEYVPVESTITVGKPMVVTETEEKPAKDRGLFNTLVGSLFTFVLGFFK